MRFYGYYIKQCKKSCNLIFLINFDGIKYYMNIINTTNIAPISIKRLVNDGKYGDLIEFKEKLVVPFLKIDDRYRT